MHQDGDLSLRVIRDLLTRNVDKVVVDSERQYRRILGWVRTTQPEFADRIQLHTGSQPLFEQYGVEAAIRSTLNRRVDLPSGGYLLFDYAEAFTVIDVNSGSSTRQSHLEETTLRTNVEAAREVMRQLRLRDIGGIIVIDFIDLERERNRKELLAVLQEELAKDRTKTYLVDISPLGLVEMTRQNTTEGVRETLTAICPTCGGEGRVLSQDTMAVEAERKLRKLARSSSSQAFRIRLNAKVAAKLAGPGGTRLIELERETGRFFTLDGEMRMPLEELDVIDEGTRADVDGDALPVKEGSEQTLKIAEPHMFNLSDGVARIDGYPVIGRRRHRLRRPGAPRAHRPRQPHRRLRDPAGRQAGADRAAAGAGRVRAARPRPRGRRAAGAGGAHARTPPSHLHHHLSRHRGRKKTAAKDEAADAAAAEAPEVVEADGDADDRGEAEASPHPRRPRPQQGGRRGRYGRRRGAPEARGRRGRAAAPTPTRRQSAAAEDGEAKPKRRRGTRGGRGRTRKPAAADDANGDQPAGGLVEPPTTVPAGDGEEPSRRGEAEAGPQAAGAKAQAGARGACAGRGRGRGRAAAAAADAAEPPHDPAPPAAEAPAARRARRGCWDGCSASDGRSATIIPPVSVRAFSCGVRSMYAVIKVGGKQYRVEQGQKLLVDRQPLDAGKSFTPDVLMTGGDSVVIDRSKLTGTVTAEVVEHCAARS